LAVGVGRRPKRYLEIADKSMILLDRFDRRIAVKKETGSRYIIQPRQSAIVHSHTHISQCVDGHDLTWMDRTVWSSMHVSSESTMVVRC
jgi:hypothetical protein